MQKSGWRTFQGEETANTKALETEKAEFIWEIQKKGKK